MYNHFKSPRTRGQCAGRRSSIFIMPMSYTRPTLALGS